MNTRTIMTERKAIPMRKKSSIYNRFYELDSKAKIAKTMCNVRLGILRGIKLMVNNSAYSGHYIKPNEDWINKFNHHIRFIYNIWKDKFTNEELEEYRSLQKSFSTHNSIRESDKNKMKCIMTTILENGKDIFLTEEFLYPFDRTIIFIESVFKNCDSLLITELKNTCKKYGIDKIVIFAKINKLPLKISSFKVNNSNAKKSRAGIAIYAQFDEKILNGKNEESNFLLKEVNFIDSYTSTIPNNEYDRIKLIYNI